MVSMTRPIDNLGRVVIPMEIRKQLNWGPGTVLDITGAEKGILVTTHQEKTIIGKAKELRSLLNPDTTSNNVLAVMDNLIDLLEED